MKLLLIFCTFLSVETLSAQKLSFNDAIQRAVERSTEIATQKAALKSLKGANLSSHLTYLPSLSVEGSHSQTAVAGTTIEERSVQAVGRLNLLKFGSDASTRARANLQERAQSQKVLDTTIQFENAAVRTLTGFIENTLRVDILIDLVELRKEALKIAGQRFNKGLLAKQEVDIVSVDLENSTAELRDAQAELTANQARIKAMLGAGQISAKWPWNEKLMDQQIDYETSELKKRPDWRSADALLKSKKANKNVAWGQIFPSLDLVGTYGYSQNRTTGQSGETLTGALTISVPLFDKLANYGNYRAAVHEVTGSEMTFEQVKRNALAEFETALGAFRIALETATRRDKTINLSSQLYEDDLKRFQRGIIGANDLNLTLARLLSSKLLWIGGWRNAHTTFVDLCHSVGKRVAQCLKKKTNNIPPSNK